MEASSLVAECATLLSENQMGPLFNIIILPTSCVCREDSDAKNIADAEVVTLRGFSTKASPGKGTWAKAQPPVVVQGCVNSVGTVPIQIGPLPGLFSPLNLAKSIMIDKTKIDVLATIWL